MIKYEVANQLTGIPEQAETYEQAIALREQVRNQYIAAMVDPLFRITVLIQNEDESWTQTLADENGQPITDFFTDTA